MFLKTLAIFILLLLFSEASQAQKLKVYISVDMEGISGVVHPDQVIPTGQDYNIARRWMTQEVNAAIRGARSAGATEIIVNDSHGDMRNIILSDLDSNATLISGTPKPLSMMEGIDETFDAVMFIGYHGKAGSINSVLDHTYSTATIHSLKINEIEMPELGVNALIAGYYNVPVVLVTGDKTVCEQAKEILGNKIVTVAVKEGIGRYAAKNLPIAKIHNHIQKQVKIALEKRKEIKPYKLNPPYKVELSYMRSSQADLAAILPGVYRIDARTIQTEVTDVLTAFKFIRALIALGKD